MSFGIYELQKSIGEIEIAMQKCFSLEEEWDNKVEIIENDTNTSLEKKDNELQEVNAQKLASQAEYLDVLLGEGRQLAEKAAGLIRYFEQSTKTTFIQSDNNTVGDISFNMPQDYVNYMKSLYEKLSSNVMQLTDASNRGLLGFGKRILGADETRKQEIFEYYKKIQQINSILYDKLLECQNQLKYSIENEKSQYYDDISRQADNKVSKIDEEYESKMRNAYDDLERQMENVLSETFLDKVEAKFEDKFNESNFPIGRYCYYIGYLNKEAYIYKLLLQHYSQYISGDYLRFNVAYDLSEQRSFVFNYTNDKLSAISLTETILLNQLRKTTAGTYLVNVCSCKGNLEGMKNISKLCRNFPEIAEGIFIQKEQLKNTILEYVEIMNDIIQNKIEGYGSLYEFNCSNKKKIPYRSLVIVDYEFEDDLCDKLLLLIEQGFRAGIQVILITHFSEKNEKLDKGILSIIQSGYAFQQVDYFWRNIYFPNIDFVPQLEKIDFTVFYNKFAVKYKQEINAILKFEDIIDCQNRYSMSSEKKLCIPIGVNETGNVLNIEMGDEVANGTSHYGLIVGPTGSGKSSLLHTIIMSSIVNYSPRELELYLLDFKQGNEFKIYENRKIPHIKCLGLDVMQEFGDSVLQDLWNVLDQRNKMFAQASKNGQDIKSISDYRRAGYEMSRILVIMDEFQVLFNTMQNKRVAYSAASKMSDFVSRARVYGIHFLLATQTLRKIFETSSLTKGTLEEMHIRIGLQCPENELSFLIGEDNLRKCVGKIQKRRGAGVYLENDVVSEPVTIQVAYTEVDFQKKILDEISNDFSDYNSNDMHVFRGEDSPKLTINEMKRFELEKNIFLLGEPIGLGQPLVIEIDKKRKSDLLIVGENQESVDNMAKIWIMQSLQRINKSMEKRLYIFDGSTMIDEKPIIDEQILSEFASSIYMVDNIFSVLHTVDKIYEEYVNRRHRMMQGKRLDSDGETIYVVVSNYQWIEPFIRIMENQDVSEFEEISVTNGFQNIDTVRNTNDPFELANIMMGELNKELTEGLKTTNKSGLQTNKVSYYKKMKTMLSNGYYCGIHFLFTCLDISAMKRLGQSELGVFRNRILFKTISKDSYSIIDTTISTETLGNNVAIYSDGVNEVRLFKPYVFVAN